MGKTSLRSAKPSISCQTAREGFTSTTTSSQWSTPSVQTDHHLSLLQLLYMNSNTQSSSSPQTIQQASPRRLYQQSDSSGSSQISVRITSRINQIRQESSSLRHFQSQLQELKQQNKELKQQNSQLRQFIKQARQDDRLQRQLQERDRQIVSLRHQLASHQYAQTYSSRQQSAINVNIEDKPYRLHSKSKHKSQSIASSLQDQTESVRLHVFDQLQQLKRIKTDKLTLEKQYYQMQEQMIILQKELKWMRSLSNKLVSMAQKISYVFKQKLFEERWQELKKAKVSWRYLKHILQYIFEIK